MSENQTIGLVILLVSVFSILGMVGWLIFSKLKGDWPAKKFWKTKKFESSDYDAIFSVENDLYENVFSAQKTAFCAKAVVSAWKELGYPNVDKVEKRFKKTGLVIANPESFFKITGVSPLYTAAVQMWFKTRILEKRFPTAVVHTNIVDRLIELDRKMMVYGEPVIHEFCHAASEIGFGDVSYNHEDPRIWEATGKENSLQAVAKKHFMRLDAK